MKKLDLISSIQKENEVNKEPNVDNVTQNIIYNNLLQKEKEDIHWSDVDEEEEEEGEENTEVEAKKDSLVKEKRIKKKAQGLKDLFKTKKNTGKNYQKNKQNTKTNNAISGNNEKFNSSNDLAFSNSTTKSKL